MPSRSLPPPPDFSAISPPPHRHLHHSNLALPIVAGVLTITCLVFLAIFYRKLSGKRTAPADLKSPHRFPYSVLRRATSSFSAANRLGQGGFGCVYRGTLPSGQEIAVKLMDPSGSLQGEREFQNELSLASRIDAACCDHVMSIIGFSSDQRSRCRRRLVLVYEYMSKGSLQDALLSRKCPELTEWRKRFTIAINIAKGIEYLHHSCDPPIVHGDIKPSNILLDACFNAKIADFGLARALTGDEIVEALVECKNGEGMEVAGGNGEDNGSIVEETESVLTEEVVLNVDQSPESCLKVMEAEAASPETSAVEASPSEGLDKTSVSEGCLDRTSVDSGYRRLIGRKKSGSGRDWWWKQDGGCGGSESGRVKDYVMEWIGSEINKERPKSEWIGTPSSVEDGTKPMNVKTEQKKHRKKLEWWGSLDEERSRREKKNRKPREWWKEEFCEELTKKKKKKRAQQSGSGGEMWWQKDEDWAPRERKRKRSSRTSIDWWLDGLSGEFRAGRRNSQDWASGDIPKSGGISSTPSMRGTVCYIAPEYGGGGQLSEKCDVYSFGVLLLVLISGRRPLQVMASPMSEFERANLISWARQLAHSGKLLELVDPSIQSLDREQALLCITIAILCLQRSPSKRPTMKEIVGMLSGEAEPPHLPFEFSPSPPSNFPFKSWRKPL